MFENKITEALASLTEADINEFAPEGNPPKVYDGKPLVIAELDDEWKRRFVLYKKSKRQIDIVKAKPTLAFIDRVEDPILDFFDEVRQGQPESWTYSTLSERWFSVIETAEGEVDEMEFPEPDEFDSHVVSTFSDQLLSHLRDKVELPEDICPSLDHYQVGVFSDWKVAIMRHKPRPTEILMVSGSPLDFSSKGGPSGRPTH